MIPIYIFYSMFGFQRTGDELWAAADQMARGFLLGATAGRTTLTGEGLQHADGHSLLLASTNPAVVAYDPAFGVRDRRTSSRTGCAGCTASDAGEHLLLPHRLQRAVSAAGRAGGPRRRGPAPRHLPALARVGPQDDRPRAQLLASGVGVPWALEAQQLLAEDWGVAADVWSVTSWTELRRDGVACDEQAFLAPGASSPRCRTSPRRWPVRPGPVVAVSGLHAGGAGPDPPVGAAATSRRSAPTGSASPTPGRRPGATSTSTARRWWSAPWPQLARLGEIDPAAAAQAAERYRLNDVTAGTTGNTGGDA